MDDGQVIPEVNTHNHLISFFNFGTDIETYFFKYPDDWRIVYLRMYSAGWLDILSDMTVRRKQLRRARTRAASLTVAKLAGRFPVLKNSSRSLVDELQAIPDGRLQSEIAGLARYYLDIIGKTPSSRQGIRGSEDQRIRGSEDQRIRGSEDQRIRGSEDQRIIISKYDMDDISRGVQTFVNRTRDLLDDVEWPSVEMSSQHYTEFMEQLDLEDNSDPNANRKWL